MSEEKFFTSAILNCPTLDIFLSEFFVSHFYVYHLLQIDTNHSLENEFVEILIVTVTFNKTSKLKTFRQCIFAFSQSSVSRACMFLNSSSILPFLMTFFSYLVFFFTLAVFKMECRAWR